MLISSFNSESGQVIQKTSFWMRMFSFHVDFHYRTSINDNIGLGSHIYLVRKECKLTLNCLFALFYKQSFFRVFQIFKWGEKG